MTKARTSRTLPMRFRRELAGVSGVRAGDGDSGRHARLGRVGVAAATVALSALLGLSAAVASTNLSFVVDSTVDAVDANVGDGACATATGMCTLRAAIQETNALPGADTVIVPAGTYALAIPPLNQNLADTGDLDITDSLTIAGAGAASTTVDGGIPIAGAPLRVLGLDRLFEVLADGGAVAFSGLGFTDGYAAEYGGAIMNNSTATVTVRDSVLDGQRGRQGRRRDRQPPRRRGGGARFDALRQRLLRERKRAQQQPRRHAHAHEQHRLVQLGYRHRTRRSSPRRRRDRQQRRARRQRNDHRDRVADHRQLRRRRAVGSRALERRRRHAHRRGDDLLQEPSRVRRRRHLQRRRRGDRHRRARSPRTKGRTAAPSTTAPRTAT